MSTPSIPYKGSKATIANLLIQAMPPAVHFVDLFAGGGAMTSAAILSGRYSSIITNDIQPGLTQFYIDAVNGLHSDHTQWVSREDFHRLKDTDPYVRYLWSFGNNGRDYLYSAFLEEQKRIEWHLAKGGEQINSRNIPEERLRRLNKLQSLKTCQAFQNISRSQLSYDQIPIPTENVVVYCDPPYINTNAYGNKNKQTFNHNEFYDWVRQCPHLVYISEYTMPEDFVPVLAISKSCTMSSTAHKKTVEKLFVHNSKLHLHPKQTLF